MNPIQLQMLKRFSQFSRNVEFFCHSGGKTGYLHKTKIEAVLNELQALGHIVEIKTGFRITERGRAALDAPSDARYDRVTNGTQTERYEPKPWESARPGADDFLQYSRKGF